MVVARIAAITLVTVALVAGMAARAQTGAGPAAGSASSSNAPSTTSPATKPALLVHVTVGATQATKAALALLVAASAQEEGHPVTVFFAGDGVELLQPDVLNSLEGLGTGKAREHMEKLKKNGARFFASGMSCKARGLKPEAMGGLPVVLAGPPKLVELAFEASRVLVY
jgi:predicted peroxiredoxin